MINQLATFPRFTEFNFTIGSVHTVTAAESGRLDRVSISVYGFPAGYIVLAAANALRCSYGQRMALRPMRESIRVELLNDGVSPVGIDDKIDAIIASCPGSDGSSEANWYDYGDILNGYASDIYIGRLLLVPTDASAQAFFNTYRTILNVEEYPTTRHT